MFFRKIRLNVSFDFRASYRTFNMSFYKKFFDHKSSFYMMLLKFEGKEEEDYVIWFSDDVQAFFKLYQFHEHEKVRIMNVNLGGEARKYIHGL